MTRTYFAATLRQLRNGFALGLTLLALTACGGSGPTAPGDPSGPEIPGDGPGANPGGTPVGGAVPAELVGTWYTGNVSSTNFYTPSTGHWDNAGGTGMFYTFKSDGTFEYGWRLYSQLYGCAMTVLVYRTGTVEPDAAGSSVLLHTTYARMHSEDNCNENGNYDKPIEQEDETLLYQFGEDDYGNEVLWIRGPDTGSSPFYPQDFGE